jgi:ubiquitin carboxyl-terminal hydrolase 14
LFVQNRLWTEVVRMLQQKLPAQEKGKYDSIIDEYFCGKFSVEMKCDEAEAETVTKTEEKFLQLSCFISEEIKYMQSGIVSKLVEKITKHSPTLEKDALYTKSSKIDRLPAYLTVQMVRFYYKERASTNAKMLRDVKFPMSFDAHDLCTKRLQDKLLPMREKFKELEDAETTKKLTLQDKEKKSETGNIVPFQFADGTSTFKKIKPIEN